MTTFGLFVGLLIIMVMIIPSNAKRLPMNDEDDDDLELSGTDARSFLNKQNEKDFNKFTHNFDCVLCKFNMIPCCAPHLCIKKRFRPDECLELKPRSTI
jgi:cytochrome c-type biogenesis protein CcmH/NrfF